MDGASASLPLHPDHGLLAQRGRRLFAKLTRCRLKRGVFKGIADLQAAINRFLRETNDNPKPLIWTAAPMPSSKRCTAGDKC